MPRESRPAKSTLAGGAPMGRGLIGSDSGSGFRGGDPSSSPKPAKSLPSIPANPSPLQMILTRLAGSIRGEPATVE